MMNSEKKNRCRELSLAEINRMAQREDSFIREAEEEHWGFIKNICSGIIADDIRIVMIAGPSSSGKTTSAYHIMRELNRLGRPAQVISLDDFYMGEKQAPLLPDGSHDYESVYALNVPKVRASLRQLLDTGRCITPIFDFNKAQPSEQTREIFLPGGTLLVEGLHGANPVITGGFEDGMRNIGIRAESDGGLRAACDPAAAGIRHLPRSGRAACFRSGAVLSGFRKMGS